MVRNGVNYMHCIHRMIGALPYKSYNIYICTWNIIVKTTSYRRTINHQKYKNFLLEPLKHKSHKKQKLNCANEKLKR